MVSQSAPERFYREPEAPIPLASEPDFSVPEVVPSEYFSKATQLLEKQIVEGTNEDPFPEARWPGQHSAAELGDYSAADETPEDKANPVGESRILGLKRRNFWILTGAAAAALIITGAVLGGVLGTSSQNDHGSHTSNDTVAPRLSPQSRLAAARWKISNDDTEYRAVFFQDSYGALLAARWSSPTSTSPWLWSIENVTQLVSGASSSRVVVPTGSALASTSSDDRSPDSLYVWYLSSASVISGFQIPTSVSGSGGWSAMQQQVEHVAYDPSSALATTLQWCGNSSQVASSDWSTTNCESPQWLLAYQDQDLGVSVINGSTWDSATAVPAGKAVDHSPLAITMRWGADPAQVALVYQQTEGEEDESATGEEDMMLSGYGISGEWADKTAQVSGLAPVNESSRQQFAGSKWDVGEQTVWYALTEEGGVRGQWFNSSDQIPLDPVVFSGFGDDDTPQFQAIAMPISGGLFYGIADGKVLEFMLNETAPWNNTFSSVVWP